MKLLSEYVDRPLKLVKKSFFGFHYNLVAGTELLAAFEYRLLFGFRGLVKGFGKPNIELYKENIFSREVLVREEGKENPFAKYRRDFGFRTGHIELPNGNKFKVHLGFLDFTTVINNENENTIASIKRTGLFSRNYSVQINEKSDPLNENPWIMFLVLYLIIKRRQRRR